MADSETPAGSPSPKPRSLKPSLGLHELLSDVEPRADAKVVRVDVREIKERAELRKKIADLESELSKERKIREESAGMFETMQRAKARFEKVPVELPSPDAAAEPEPTTMTEAPREEPMDNTEASAPDEPSHQVAEPHASPGSPGLTPLPRAAFQNGALASFTWLRQFIREQWRHYEKLSPQRPAQFCTGWYAPPGAPMEKALPIDVKHELVERPFRDGTYYMHVRRQPNQDSPNDLYYYAHVHTRADAEQASTAKLSANMIILRASEDLSVRLKEAMDRERAQAIEIGILREDVNSFRDDLAASERQCRALEDEIERLKAAGEPLMSAQAADEIGVKAINRLQMILEDPGAKAKAEFDRLRDFNRRLYEVIRMLFQGFFERPALLRVILEDAPDLFDAIVQHVNTLAEESEQQERYLPSGQVMEQLKLLPAHVMPDEVTGSDDEMLEALAEADRTIVDLRARNAELKQQLETEREANEALVSEEEEEASAPRRAPAKRQTTGAAKGPASGKAAPKNAARRPARAKAPPPKNATRAHRP